MCGLRFFVGASILGDRKTDAKGVSLSSVMGRLTNYPDGDTQKTEPLSLRHSLLNNKKSPAVTHGVTYAIPRKSTFY